MSWIRTQRWLSSALVSAATILIAAVAPAQQYTYVDLGNLGGVEAEAMAVNDLGYAVGWSFTSGISNRRAFLWNGTNMQNLGTLGGNSSMAWDINNKNQVVGGSLRADGVEHAFLWEDGQMIDLGALNNASNRSIAFAINENDTIVGYSETGELDNNGNPIFHAVRWTRGIFGLWFISDLGVYPGYVRSWARDVNNDGIIVGMCDKGPINLDRIATKWEGGGIQFLGSFGGPHAEAHAINDDREIVGYSTLPDGTSRAFHWENGILRNLGSLTTSYSTAYDINAFGHLCGDSYRSSPVPGPKAVRWLNANNIQNLNFLVPNGTPVLRTAWDTSNTGMVAGRAEIAKAFLLIPNRLSVYMDRPDPGVAGQNNRFNVYGCTPGGLVRIYWGLRVGSTSVPGCPGVTLDIRSANFGVSGTADANGHYGVTAFTSGAASGRVIRYQAVDVATCRTSNRVDYRYP